MYITIHYSSQQHNTNYKTEDIQGRVLRMCLLSCDTISSQALIVSIFMVAVSGLSCGQVIQGDIDQQGHTSW